jgi:hypothetical protein
LRDGADITQFGREWIKKEQLEINLITNAFEKLIVSSKPKAQPTIGNTNFNNPF